MLFEFGKQRLWVCSKSHSYGVNPSYFECMSAQSAFKLAKIQCTTHMLIDDPSGRSSTSGLQSKFTMSWREILTLHSANVIAVIYFDYK